MQCSTKLSITWFHILHDVITMLLNNCLSLCFCNAGFFVVFFTRISPKLYSKKETSQYEGTIGKFITVEVVCFSFILFV